MMMETVRMQPTMPHPPQHHHLQQMVYKPSIGPAPDDVLLSMDVNGSTSMINGPMPDFQLADLHQTLDSLLNNSNNSSNNNNNNNNMAGQSYQHPIMEFHDTRQFSSVGPHSDIIRYSSFPNRQHQFFLVNCPSGTKHANKRMSMEYSSNNLSDYSVDSWTNSPRSGTSSDESLDATKSKTTKYRTPKSVSSIGSYQSGSKRQNVGQRIQVLPAERLVAQNMPVQRFNMAPQAHPNGAINSNFPYLPARAVFMPQMANAPFYGMPRIADLPNVSHSSQQQNGPNGQYIPQPRSQVLQIYGPRLPLPPPATHQEHHHQLQQQNFYFSGPMGPPPAKTPDDPSKAEKKARFLRTAQILEQSGLMECTLKTAALMRENASLQREIDALTTESNHIINHFLSSQLNDNGIKPHQQLAFENQNQQMHAQVHSQHQNHGQSPMSLPIMLYPGGMA